MNIIETTHKHLAVFACRFKPAVDNSPVAFFVTPLRAETVFEIIRHDMRIFHTALNIKFINVHRTVDILERQLMVSRRHRDIFNRKCPC